MALCIERFTADRHAKGNEPPWANSYVQPDGFTVHNNNNNQTKVTM